MSVRATLVTAISIPTSVLITFIGIQAFGFSLNILTLGALTIAIGRVVDDSIVVIENIKRHYVGDADKRASILRAVREVAMAITSSTITTVAVFLPIAFVGDITGELFRPFALTVTIAMTASLLVALTIVPVLAYWFLRPGKALLDAEGRQIDPEAWDAPPSRLQRSYLPILRWTLRHSWVTLSLAVLVLVGTIAAVPFMKTNFLGDSGQNTFTITQEIGPAPSLAAEDAAAQQVESALQGIDGIQTVQVSIGSSGSALRDAFRGGGSGITYSVTTDPSADQVKLRADVEAALANLDNAGTITVAASGGGFGSSDITIDVTAPDSNTLKTATDAVVTAVSGADGIGQVSSNLSASLPYIAVTVDRDKAAALGLSEVAVGAIVSNTMQPQGIGNVEIGDTKLTVYLASSSIPATVDELKGLPIPSATGPIPLSQVATVEQSQGPTSITTQDGKRTATVTATPSTDNLQTASAAVSTALKTADLPASASASVGGVVSQQSDAFGQLGLALLAAILIVYIVMVATFKSLRQPLLLLVSVPFAATGAILLQIITGVPLGVASLIGVLMLIGIVVTNAIVLVDLVNQYRGRGLSAHDATIAGGGRRLRPILMTALATIFALTPMALGVTGHGGFISQPLAIVVIGGLISSTVLTLLVLPTLYNLVEGAKERRAARRGEKTDAVTPAVESEPMLVGAGAAASASGAPLTRRERRALEAGEAATAVVAVPLLDEGPDIEVPAGEAAPAVATARAAESVGEPAESAGEPAESAGEPAVSVGEPEESAAEPAEAPEEAETVEAFVPESAIDEPVASEPVGEPASAAEQVEASDDAPEELIADGSDSQPESVPEESAAEPESVPEESVAEPAEVSDQPAPAEDSDPDEHGDQG
jgi:HAE1 family hydrophobic/amphiphilic exporter-1